MYFLQLCIKQTLFTELCSKVNIIDICYLLNKNFSLGFISNKMPEKLLDLLDQMVIEPDDINTTFILNACAQLNNDRAMRIGKKFLHEKLNKIRNNNVILNSAIHMLMKFRDVTSAENIFEMIKKKDMYTYGTMMKGN